MDTIVELLRAQPVFAGLNSPELAALAGMMIRRDLEERQALAMQGDVWPYLFLVAEGELDAIKGSAEGRNLLVTTFVRGELFWGLAFFQEHAPQIVTLEACCPTRVYLWSRKRAESVFISNGRLGWELCHLMIQRMQRASAIVDDLAFQTVANRLAHLLLEHFDRAGESSVERSLTLDEMAARIGTTREMVCRILYRFADEQLIRVTRTEFVLTDRSGLSRLSGG